VCIDVAGSGRVYTVDAAAAAAPEFELPIATCNSPNRDFCSGNSQARIRRRCSSSLRCSGWARDIQQMISDSDREKQINKFHYAAL